MVKDVKYDLFLIDILDFFYVTYSDILINKDRYKSYKNLKPVVAYSIILKFLKDLENNSSKPNSKFFFYIKKGDIRSIDLKRIKNSISKREKNIDQNFDYFFNILIEILKNYKDNYFLYYNDISLTDSIMSINKNNNVLIVSSKFDMCYYLMDSDSIHWYNHNLTYDQDSFSETFKFLPTAGKLLLYSILNKKPLYKNKMYKNYHVTSEMSTYLTNKFDSFDDMVTNYAKKLSGDTKKKIYSWMKIFLINKQSMKNSEYSLFDLDSGHIFKSKSNPRILNIWRKVLKIEI